MERCRSSEAGLGSQPIAATPIGDTRDSRRRDVKATSLLFSKVPSKEQIYGIEKAEVFHLEAPVTMPGIEQQRAEPVDDKMDIDLDDQPELLSEEAVAGKMAAMQEAAPQVWGMPKWGWEREEVRKGVRVLGMEEVSPGT